MNVFEIETRLGVAINMLLFYLYTIFMKLNEIFENHLNFLTSLLAISR